MNLHQFFTILCLCCVCGLPARAQVLADDAANGADETNLQGVNVEEERERIKKTRETSLEQYRKAIKACYQKIAVNGCKMDAQQKKIEIDNDLRRQEILLNAYQRQLKTDKAIQKLEEKQSVESQIDKQDKSIEFHNSYLEKLQENLEKNEKHLQQAEQIEANREKFEKRLEEIKERQRKQQEKAVEVSKKRAEYQRKLDEAEKHRQQVENDNANRKQVADPALPKPRPEDMPK